jgi:hypothetical protein
VTAYKLKIILEAYDLEGLAKEELEMVEFLKSYFDENKIQLLEKNLPMRNDFRKYFEDFKKNDEKGIKEN